MSLDISMSSVVTGISHSLEKSSETHLPSTFWDIPRISHIPKNRKTLCTGNYMGYPRDIPYPKKKENFYVPEIFWDIPWDIPYPKKLKISMYRFFFGISLGYPISRKSEIFLCTGFFLGYPISQYFLKLCTAWA